MHGEPERRTERCGAVERGEGAAVGVRVAPRVQLDGVGAEVARGAHLRVVGVDEQAGPHAGCPERRQLRGEASRVAGHVEPALGGHLLAPLRDERHLTRPEPEGELDHRVRSGDLEVEHVRTTRASASTSASWTCRRSSRRCAVMPSAPASSHMVAARTGSGSSPRRACRSVATWSTLT
jgi:hypothetical protein